MKYVYKHLSIFLLVQFGIVVFFAAAYYLTANYYPPIGASFEDLEDGNEISFTDALYLSIVTHSTVGYGGIRPKSGFARFISGMHMSVMIMSIAYFHFQVINMCRM